MLINASGKPNESEKQFCRYEDDKVWVHTKKSNPLRQQENIRQTSSYTYAIPLNNKMILTFPQYFSAPYRPPN